MAKNKKCKYGYIDKEKKKQLLFTILFILIGLAIFLVGYFLNHRTKTNVFTIVAILMVLPMAKRFVAFVVLFPYKTEPLSFHEKVEQLVNDSATVIEDYVFTSSEKVMGISVLIIDQGNVIGLVANDKQPYDYMKTYLRKSICAISPNQKVKLVKNFEQLEREYKNLVPAAVSEKQEQAVLDRIKSFAV